MPEQRLIEANKLKAHYAWWGDTEERRTLDDIVDAQPTVDAVPVVHARWKLFGNDDDVGSSYWCSACNFALSEDLFYIGYKDEKWVENHVFKYCPNCGCKMDAIDALAERRADG